MIFPQKEIFEVRSAFVRTPRATHFLQLLPTGDAIPTCNRRNRGPCPPAHTQTENVRNTKYKR